MSQWGNEAMRQWGARAIVVSVVGVAGAFAAQAWTVQTSGVTVTFRGVSAVDAQTAWVSGSRGTVLRTADGGVTWANVSPGGAEKLDIRDVDAIDGRTAYALSIGNGDQSRIFKTTDAGQTWVTQFVSQDADAFYDAMAFWDDRRGIAFSDSAGGLLRILTTIDGGTTWSRVPTLSLPAALDNEGAFAASGTNVAVWGSQHAWIGTGAAATARVLRTSDGGRTWAVSDTPLAAGPTSGIYSIAFRDALHGIVVGGDYSKEGEAVDNAAVTSDGGVTWTLVRGLGGFRSVVTPLPGGTGRRWMALGPSGADRTEDDGRTWTPVEVPVRGLHTFSLARAGEVGWAAGGRGQIAKWFTR
jgi:photosystem II stability/assembly factor-like uncharacterized protein